MTPASNDSVMATRASNAVLTPDSSAFSECLDRLAANKASNRPISTYRLQFHSGFKFSDARKLLPYFKSLGVTHIYASPILKARAGSMHGYDITNHNEINPELGIEEEFRDFVADLKQHGLALLLDTVPNHMGVGHGTNPWWQDLLENGRTSQYADFFDIDWEPFKTELRNKVLIPVLGESFGEELDSGKLKLEFTGSKFTVSYYDKILPIDPQTYPIIFEPLGDLRVQPPAVSPTDEERTEFEGILWDLRQLPPNYTTDGDLAERRRREIPSLINRLSVVVERAPRVRALIDHAVAISNGTPGDARSFDALHRLLDAQAYRIAHWRVSSHEINYRRFFDVNDLIGLRMENPRVFAATHKLVRRLLADGTVSGLRIDHPDGLLNPVQYFTRLQMLYAAARCCGTEPNGQVAENGIEVAIQEVFGQHVSMAPLFVLVEKILERGEHLPHEWPVDGTVGYEFTNLVNGLFIDESNHRALTNTYRRFAGVTSSVGDMIYDAKKLIMRSALASEVTVLSHMLEEISSHDRRARDFTRHSLTEAIRETIACFPVYRTYIDERGTVTERDRGYITQAIAQAKRRNAGTAAAIFNFLGDILLLKDRELDVADAHRRRLQFTLKFQQLTGPVMAKGLEDTVCYRYNRLISCNEVGGSPENFGISVEEFHSSNLERARDWPSSMLATSTHDTKRSEDVRARIDVISEMPRQWTSLVMRWRRANRAKKKTLADGRTVPDANEEYLLYQTIVGAWPARINSDAERQEFTRRIQQYMNKAVHEAKVNLSWVNDNPEYIAALDGFIDRILGLGTAARPNAFLQDLVKVGPAFQLFGGMNSLAQTLLKLTVPGLPDVYQGNELFDYSLVDPDNRRAVDFDLRQRCLAELEQTTEGAAGLVQLCAGLMNNLGEGQAKMWTTMRALRFRREHAPLFQSGSYEPLHAIGDRREHAVAFAREHSNKVMVVAVPRLSYKLMHGEVRPPLGDVWGDTELVLPRPSVNVQKPFVNIFTGESLHFSASRTISCHELFRHFPVALLASD